VSTVSHRPLVSTIGSRIERLPMTRWQTTVRCVIGVVTFFDAFDQLLISYILPVIRSEWRMSSGSATWAVTSGSLGMLLGALCSGRLADRYGRVRIIVISLLLYSVSSLALAFSPGLGFFLVLRFVQGIGIGGEVPVAATYIGEIAKAHRRGRFVLLYELIFPFGLAAAALVSVWVVPTFGWRWMPAVGALPLPAAYLIHRIVPESPRWLADRGYAERAEETMAQIERKVGRLTGAPLPEPEAATAPAPAPARSTWRDLFAGRYRRRTLTIWSLWFTSYLVAYGLASWMPTVYRNVFHLSLSRALTYSLLSTLAGIVGAVLIALTVDRIGRRWALGISLVTGGMMLIVLWALGARSAGELVLWCSLAVVFVNAANLGLYLYTPELYPTQHRALGSSIAGAWNRLGVIVGPILFAAFYRSGGGLAHVILVLGGVAVAGGLTALVFAEETANRTLEELSP
jgi:MFS transporter, putative metabolite:H+ symporter